MYCSKKEDSVKEDLLFTGMLEDFRTVTPRLGRNLASRLSSAHTLDWFAKGMSKRCGRMQKRVLALCGYSV